MCNVHEGEQCDLVHQGKREHRAGCSNYRLLHLWTATKSRPTHFFENNTPALKGGGTMARAPSFFRQQDVTKAIRATKAAGIDIARIEIDRAGKIVIITGAPEAARSRLEEGNEWDHV
jgi:hypothetical protein